MTSMEESARKGLECYGTYGTLKRKSRRQPTREIAAIGFDTSLPRDENEMRLKKHFSSCGEVRDVCILRDPPKSFAVVGLEECALDKALELSGSDMDGCKIVVNHVFPPHDFPRIFLPPSPPSIVYDAMVAIRDKKKKREDGQGSGKQRAKD